MDKDEAQTLLMRARDWGIKMKIAELIRRLRIVCEVHGNLEVEVRNKAGEFDEIDFIGIRYSRPEQGKANILLIDTEG